MSLEAIKTIKDAEESAVKSKQAAEQRARNVIEEAKMQGREAVQSAVLRAEEEVLKLKRASDQKAAEEAKELVSTTANRRAALSVRAESRLDKAATLIVERIVNG